MRLAVTAIPEFRDGAKLAFLSFQSKDGEKFQAGVAVDFAKTLSVGDKAEAEVETIPGKDGKQDWRKLKSWDGKPTEPDRPQFKGGGGGGGGGRPQRTPEEAASIMAQTVAVQSAHMYAGILQSRAMQDPKATFDANEFAKIARAVSDAIADSFGAMLAKVKS